MRTSPLRGIGFTANKFATEAFIDEIAAKRGVDPVEFRLELLKNTPRARAVVERVAEMADWGRKRDGRALGFAFVDYSGSQVAGIAEVSVDRASGQIRLHNFWCAIDCGIAVQPDNVVGADREQHRLWPGHGADRAHHDQGRRRSSSRISTTISCRA